MKRKNLYLITLTIFSLAVISFGTYALWDLGEGLFTNENTITSGQVIMSYSEKNEITLSSALPMNDKDGKKLDEYFDFSVSTYIKTKANDSTPRRQYYNILLEKLSATTNTTALNDSEIKVYLTEVEADGSETEVLAPTTVDDLDNYLLKSSSQEFKNGKERVEKNYRLRAWIDFDVDANKFNGEKNYSYNFRININNEVVNLDTSGANKPELLSNMLPAYYDGNTWRKADSLNKNDRHKWYDYDSKMWANAVTVYEEGYIKKLNDENKSVNISDSSFEATGFTSQYVSELETSGGTMCITIKTGNSPATVSFDYNIESVSGQDIFFVMDDNEEPLFAIEGTSTSGTIPQEIPANSTIKVILVYMGASTDKATLSNFVIPEGVTVLVGDYFFDGLSIRWKIVNDENATSFQAVNNIIATDYTLDVETGVYTLEGISNTLISSDAEGKYVCEDITERICNKIYKVKNASNKITKVDEYISEEGSIRERLINAEVGTEISMDEINAMWVWIPRYTYTYFASNTPTSIQIQFEKGTTSSGTITCTDNVSGSGTTSQTCTDLKTSSLVVGQSTYTHPAFTFGDKELTGFWMGKFENSATDNLPVEHDTPATTGEHELIIKPNHTSLRYKAVSYQFRDARQMEKANNIYGFEQSSSTTFNLDGTLTGDTNKLDTHMLKNTEWGAATYLSHSKYGINKEVVINSQWDYTTGCGPQSVDSISPGALCNSYNTVLGQSASTTGNVYGVYDMSGGSWEYVMGNMVNSSNEFYPLSAGQWSATIKPLTKYYDSYTYDESDLVYTRGRLGDATVEMQPNDEYSTWYFYYASFPYSEAPWFVRGGDYSNEAAVGVFYFLGDYGDDISGFTGFRSVVSALD